MAYISTPEVKEKREKLKAQFPKFRFSVRRDNMSSIEVAILSGPLELPYGVIDHYKNPHEIGQCSGKGDSVNQYWYKDHYKADYHIHNVLWLGVLEKMLEIINEGNWDESDAQTDYFNCGFYANLQIGKWNKPYEVKT